MITDWRGWAGICVALVLICLITVPIYSALRGGDRPHQVRAVRGVVSATTSDVERVEVLTRVAYSTEPEQTKQLAERYGKNGINEMLILPTAGDTIRRHIAGLSLQELLVSRSDLADSAEAALRAAVQPEGIRIEDLTITDVTFTPRLSAARGGENKAEAVVHAVEELKTRLAGVQAACEPCAAKGARK